MVPPISLSCNKTQVDFNTVRGKVHFVNESIGNDIVTVHFPELGFAASDKIHVVEVFALFLFDTSFGTRRSVSENCDIVVINLGEWPFVPQPKHMHSTASIHTHTTCTQQ